MIRSDEEAAELDILIGRMHAALRQTADEIVLEAYADGLDDIPMADLRAAIRTASRSSQYVPTVPELRKLAGFDVSMQNRALIMFAELDLAISRHGTYKSVRFDDPIMNQTLNDLGGWVHIGDTNPKEWNSFFRKRFLETYISNAEARRGTMAAQLGIAAQANVAIGMSKFDKPPVEIGVNLPRLDRLNYEKPKTDQRLGFGNIAGLLKDARNEGEKP